MKAFDKKFGTEFIGLLPQTPAVYLIYDAAGTLIYVGKAKNLRRRLGQYRNAKRCKKHLKMRSIIQNADRIEFRPCDSDAEALWQETELIQAHRPRWNVAGAFYFLYPMIGMRLVGGAAYFCYTTEPELCTGYEFHGAFRSRDRTWEAFFSLMKLLSYVGHPIPRKQVAKISADSQAKYAYHFGFRQLPESWVNILGRFWKGESNSAIEELVLSLIENAGARRSGRQVQEHLNNLKRFWRHEAIPLAQARAVAGGEIYPIPQKQRDFIFLKKRLGRNVSS